MGLQEPMAVEACIFFLNTRIRLTSDIRFSELLPPNRALGDAFEVIGAHGNKFKV